MAIKIIQLMLMLTLLTGCFLHTPPIHQYNSYHYQTPASLPSEQDSHERVMRVMDRVNAIGPVNTPSLRKPSSYYYERPQRGFDYWSR